MHLCSIIENTETNNGMLIENRQSEESSKLDMLICTGPTRNPPNKPKSCGRWALSMASIFTQQNRNLFILVSSLSVEYDVIFRS